MPALVLADEDPVNRLHDAVRRYSGPSLAAGGLRADGGQDGACGVDAVEIRTGHVLVDQVGRLDDKAVVYPDVGHGAVEQALPSEAVRRDGGKDARAQGGRRENYPPDLVWAFRSAA